MKLTLLVSLLTLTAPTLFAGKLTQEERIQIIRGMMSEYSTVKVLLPRSKKALTMEAGKAYDKQEFAKALQEHGPAGRVGDLIQITKVDLEDDKIILQLNGGFKGGRKWYENVQVGGGVGMNTRTVPIGGGSMAQSGTTIALVFPKEYESLSVAEIKTWLKPVIDFDKQRSATETFVEQLPKEQQEAIKEKKAIEGMDRDAVILSMGKPRSKSREVKDGVELEDWLYGQAPGKITFVTFDGNKVVRVKETYAGLGGETAKPLPAQN
jgi:hypothetical protein